MAELPMADERAERCETCRFFDDSRQRNPAGELVPLEGMVAGTVLGDCRRFPPSIPFESKSSGHVNADYPNVYQNDWCGEWRAKDEAAPAG